MKRLSALSLSLLFLCFGLLPAAAQGFGGAVAIGEQEVFVGETQNSMTSGTVYVFREEAGTWTEQARLTASDEDGRDNRFGRALSVDGNTLVVGATTRANTKGGAYLFEKGGDTWREKALLLPAETVEGDHVGRAVAVENGVALVSSAGKDEGRGAVYVFRRDADGTWQEEAKLVGQDLEPDNYFGLSVALSGNVALIGAPFYDRGTGAVFAFRYDAETGRWDEGTRLEARELRSGVRFGYALDLEGHTALVGVPRFEGNMGGVFAFTLNPEEGTWVQAHTLTPFDGERGRFGTSVAFDGEKAWIGAPISDGTRGAVYQYSFDEASGQWTDATRIQANDLNRNDYFAEALAVAGPVAVVGAVGDDFETGTARLFVDEGMQGWQEKAVLVNELQGYDPVTGGKVSCTEGSASVFDCKQMDLVAFLPMKDVGGGRGVQSNDLWGWTDPETDKEYVLLGRVDGTSFVDISNPYNPRYLGNLPLTEGSLPSYWRDIKVYKNHAFIVADVAGAHGLQVFDLTRLREVDETPVTFTEDARYDKIHSAHNIVINEETGFAYAVGSSSGGTTCGGGLHMINIQDPLNPTFAGCFADPLTGNSSTGYSHDAQCVLYRGPDADHQGKEICFGANETALSIADVTDKETPVALSRASYPNVGYTHQGWLTEDHKYVYMNDETDETGGLVSRTRTLIWDVTDLDDPQLVKEHFGENAASDHNLYIKGNIMYQSNYLSGLRVLDITDVENPVEIGYFDTVPVGENIPGMTGSWSNYPYFKSGVIAVSSMQEGLFLLKKKKVDI